MLVDRVIHVVLVLAMPPLLLGVINKIKAAFAGRQGPPVLQLYYDLFKLARKRMVVSVTTTPMFFAGPVIGATTVVVAAMLVPLGHHRAVLAFPGDMIMFAYLLALGRFFTAAAALDTGSPFEGMGAAREVTFAWLTEPTLFLGFVALARLSGSLSLSDMLTGALPVAGSLALGAFVLILVGWFVVLLAESCRIPFDDPNTHLELTMIHEVMVLDHSGPALGLILYGASIKLFAFGALVVSVALPASSGSTWIDWLVFVAAMLLLAIVIGIVESSMARLRLVSIPKLLVSASLATVFAIVILAN